MTVPGGPYAVTAETGGDKNIGVPDPASAPHTLDLHTSNGAITVKPAA
ncbi:hypothetical protein [Phaeacidiphilus oryzae]|nr:hypothetical protein [Phaeacidiphilus oryzae]